MVSIHCFLNNFDKPTYMWISKYYGHVFRQLVASVTSEWRVFESVDAKEATW